MFALGLWCGGLIGTVVGLCLAALFAANGPVRKCQAAVYRRRLEAAGREIRYWRALAQSRRRANRSVCETLADN